jgi:hypothetical protein
MVRRKTHTYDFVDKEIPTPLKGLIEQPGEVFHDYHWVDQRVFRYWDVKNAVRYALEKAKSDEKIISIITESFPDVMQKDKGED